MSGRIIYTLWEVPYTLHRSITVSQGQVELVLNPFRAWKVNRIYVTSLLPSRYVNPPEIALNPSLKPPVLPALLNAGVLYCPHRYVFWNGERYPMCYLVGEAPSSVEP